MHWVCGLSLVLYHFSFLLSLSWVYSDKIIQANLMGETAGIIQASKFDKIIKLQEFYGPCIIIS